MLSVLLAASFVNFQKLKYSPFFLPLWILQLSPDFSIFCLVHLLDHLGQPLLFLSISKRPITL